jgi:hypothetical protein
MQGRQKLEKELKKLDDEKGKTRNAEVEKNQQEEEAKKDGQGHKEQEKAKAETRKWLESELASIKEAIRVRREVAVARGAVKINRITEGEGLYGDDVEPGLEKIIVPQPEPQSPKPLVTEAK